MRYVGRAGAILCFVLILGGFYAYSFNSAIPLLGFDKPDATGNSRPLPLFDLILVAIAMLAGILFGSIYERLKQRKRAVTLGKELAAVLSSPSFYRSLLAAPIVFAGVYTAAKAQPDQVVAFLFAFQNGFFCDAVLRQQEPTP